MWDRYLFRTSFDIIFIHVHSNYKLYNLYITASFSASLYISAHSWPLFMLNCVVAVSEGSWPHTFWEKQSWQCVEYQLKFPSLMRMQPCTTLNSNCIVYFLWSDYCIRIHVQLAILNVIYYAGHYYYKVYVCIESLVCGIYSWHTPFHTKLYYINIYLYTFCI